MKIFPLISHGWFPGKNILRNKDRYVLKFNSEKALKVKIELR